MHSNGASRGTLLQSPSSFWYFPAMWDVGRRLWLSVGRYSRVWAVILTWEGSERRGKAVTDVGSRGVGRGGGVGGVGRPPLFGGKFYTFPI